MLYEAESRLAATSTRTKERLRMANEELAKMKTTTHTREELKRVEKEIQFAREKETSSYTMEEFKKKQEILANLLEQNKNADTLFFFIRTSKNGLRLSCS